MIPLHCLWAKSNSKTRGQFKCDVTWFCFCFDFICSHYFIVGWRGWWGEGGEGRGEACLKLNVQGQGSGNILDVDGHGRWGS